MRPHSLWPIVLASTLAVAAVFVAYAAVATHVDALDVMRAAPRASLAHPRSGPAVYSGTVMGPAGRKSATGLPSASHWWTVTERVGKKEWKTVCFEREFDGMRLEEGGRSAPLEMFDGEDGFALLSDERDFDWDGSRVIDLADTPTYKSTTLPEMAAKCRRDGRRFVARTLPQGARVDVLACYERGALRACPRGALKAVLSVRGLATHVARRTDEASKPLVILGTFAFIVLALLLASALRFRASVFGALSVERVNR